MSKPLSSQSRRPPLREQVLTQSVENPDAEDSLFIRDRTAADEDQTWEPQNYDEDDGAMLGWDTSNDQYSDGFRLAHQGHVTATRFSNDIHEEARPTQEGIEPTQRLSQVSIPVSFRPSIIN
jgi:cell cycle checkpoint control protein RAD9A